MSSSIRYEVDDGVAVITIDRPEKRNAMSYEVLEEFHAALSRAGDDADARAIVIAGTGGAFCAGTDLSDLAATPNDARFRRTRSNPAPRGWPIQLCPKPVVAAVDGPAVGMGAEFASQCDVRVASTRARFAWNFVHRGLVPDTGAGTWLLPRQVGLSAALRLVLSGEFIGAEEALSLGFVLAVVEPDAVVEVASAEARRLSSGSPFAARLVKELMYEGLARDIPEHLAHTREAMTACFASEDHREGVASFLERRPARFVGR